MQKLLCRVGVAWLMLGCVAVGCAMTEVAIGCGMMAWVHLRIAYHFYLQGW